MKRVIAITLLVCLFICGCQDQREPVHSPVTFFYRRAEFDHGSETSVLTGEIRESEGYQGNLKGLLEQYLQGPVSEHLDATFPANTRLIDYRVEENTALITVSDTLSQLTGIDLTVACACLAKTVIGLTGLESVQIQAESAMLGNDAFIVMDASSLLLQDSTENDS